MNLRIEKNNRRKTCQNPSTSCKKRYNSFEQVDCDFQCEHDQNRCFQSPTSSSIPQNSFKPSSILIGDIIYESSLGF